MYRSGTTALINSNEEMKDIMKIFKSLEESGLLIKGISETVKNEAKVQNRGFKSRWRSNKSRTKYLMPTHPK